MTCEVILWNRMSWIPVSSKLIYKCKSLTHPFLPQHTSVVLVEVMIFLLSCKSNEMKHQQVPLTARDI